METTFAPYIERTLILIILEYTLRASSHVGVWLFLHVNVLILIILEHTLRGQQPYAWTAFGVRVLILIILEHTLRDIGFDPIEIDDRS